MKILITILALTFFSRTYAFDLSNKFGLGAGVGFPVPVFGNQFNDVADPEWGASLYGRYHFTSALGMELGVSKSEFKDTPMNFENINLLGLYRLAGAASMTPVLGLGVGLTRIKEYSPSSAKLSVLGRLGAEFDLVKSLTLGALVDYQYVSKIMGDMPTNPAHVIIPQIALTWYFGGDKEEMHEEKPVMKQEEKAAMKEDIVSTGVAATERNKRKADLTVLFDTEKDVIKSEYLEKIKRVANQLKDDYQLASIIEGHADSTGPKSFNNPLSKRRAAAVKKKLIEYGVSADRIYTEGFGEDQPVADNRTKEGRKQNRRSAVFISVETRRDVM